MAALNDFENGSAPSQDLYRNSSKWYPIMVNLDQEIVFVIECEIYPRE
jgi:hypothetical protein